MRKVKMLSTWCMIGTMFVSPLSTFAAVQETQKKVEGTEIVVQNLEEGTTYYIDATGGNDSNSGTSPDAPWQSLEKASSVVYGAGDQILFKSAEMWQGTFAPQGSGERGAPIVVNSYTYENGEVRIGEGAKPIINGAGEVLYAVELYNVEFWELHNLEVTNLGEQRAKGRTGVMIHSDNNFDTTEDSYVEHIYVKDLYVHSVNGDLTTKDYNNGGIFYRINADNTNPLTYKDIKIQGNYVKDVSRTGISFGSTGSYHEIIGKALNQSSTEDLQKALHHDVEITNNYVERAGGDAIVPQYCYEGLIEYNVSQEASVNTIGNPNLMYSAGIWGWQCYNTLYQYNEAYGTYLNGDGQGYDCDWGWGTTYQYNYSHDNEGGFMLICFNESIDSVVRYNISQNDKRSLFMTSNRVPATVYNNTFYLDDSVSSTQMFAPYNGAANFYNNIFYNTGTPREMNWNRGNVSYDSNLYYGFTNTPVDNNKITVDPMFVDPGNGGTGTLESGPVLESLHGYELQANSPAINAGMYVGQDRLPSVVAPITTDFYGNETGTFTVDLGAIDTQTLDSTLRSFDYEVDQVSKTINGVRQNTTVEDFGQNIAIETNAILTIYQATEQVTTGMIEEGMIVEVTLGDKVTQYTIGEIYRDEIAPQLLGISDTKIVQGSEFNPMEGITATDNEDGDITEQIQVTGEVNTERVGVSTLTYTVQDSAGNQTTANRRVEVMAADRYFRMYDQAIINEQGPSVFYKYRQGSTIGDMILQEGSYWKHPNNWASAAKRVSDNVMEVAASGGTDGMLVYRLPKAGEITLTDTVRVGFPQESSGTINYRIELNGEKIWPLNSDWQAMQGATPVIVEDLKLQVQEGDELAFVAGIGTHNRPVVFIDPVIMYDEEEVPPTEEATVSLVGASEVKAGETIQIALNLAQVEEIYAQDIIITFDSNLFTFVRAQARANHQLLSCEVDGNNIRILAATPVSGVTGSDNIMDLTFEVAPIEDVQVGNMQIVSAKLGKIENDNSSTVESATRGTTITVQGEPTNPEPVLPGDINEDGIIDVADLALVAYYYQAKQGDDNWAHAVKADVTGDNKVDIDDLTFIATKILE